MTDVEQLKNLIKIDPDNLDASVLEQPVHYYEIAEHLVQAMSDRDQAEEDLKRIEAELNITKRQELEDDGIKVTEGRVNSEVLSDPKRIEAREKLLEQKRRVNQLTELKESMKQRAHMIRELVQLWVTNYYNDGDVQSPAVTEQQKEMFAEEARKRSSESRKNRRKE